MRLEIGLRTGAYLLMLEFVDDTVVKRSDLLMEESVVSFGDGMEREG